jgi:hypothetical protein
VIEESRQAAQLKDRVDLNLVDPCPLYRFSSSTNDRSWQSLSIIISYLVECAILYTQLTTATVMRYPCSVSRLGATS